MILKKCMEFRMCRSAISTNALFETFSNLKQHEIAPWPGIHLFYNCFDLFRLGKTGVCGFRFFKSVAPKTVKQVLTL